MKYFEFLVDFDSKWKRRNLSFFHDWWPPWDRFFSQEGQIIEKQKKIFRKKNVNVIKLLRLWREKMNIRKNKSSAAILEGQVL